MEPNVLNRRAFLATGGIAAAGLAAGFPAAKASAVGPGTIRCGFVGVGNPKA